MKELGHLLELRIHEVGSLRECMDGWEKSGSFILGKQDKVIVNVKLIEL